MSCLRFYYGTGVRKDLARARACFERSVAGEGASMVSLDRLNLATMLIDAQGGPADPKRAEAIFAGCDKEAGALGVLEKRRAPSPGRAPLDFCHDIGGSTLSFGLCLGRERDAAEIERTQAQRQMNAKLDAKGKKLAADAAKAWSVFAEKQGDAAGDNYRGGSLASNASVRHQNELEVQRTHALAKLFEYKPAPAADPARAERDLDKAYHGQCETDAQRKKLCAAARGAFVAYRDAEVALYVHVHGASLGAKDVERDVKARVTSDYAKDIPAIFRP
jgi:uncharacterized protein YecT (DUF1311 family)